MRWVRFFSQTEHQRNELAHYRAFSCFASQNWFLAPFSFKFKYFFSCEKDFIRFDNSVSMFRDDWDGDTSFCIYTLTKNSQALSLMRKSIGIYINRNKFVMGLIKRKEKECWSFIVEFVAIAFSCFDKLMMKGCLAHQDFRV